MIDLPKICLGCSKIENPKILYDLLDLGESFIDTAHLYEDSEQIIGKTIKSNRNEYIIATKFGLSKNPKFQGNNPKVIKKSLEKSLKDLQTNYVDIFIAHIYDFETNIEDIIDCLEKLKTDGKILNYGFSNTPSWIIPTQTSLIQIEYNLLNRTSEIEFFPLSKYKKIQLCSWSPLCKGFLLNEKNKSNRWNNKNGIVKKNKLIKLASQYGYNLAEISISWIKSKNIIPVVRTSSKLNLKQNIDSLKIQLPNKLIKELEKISCLQKSIYPYNVITSPYVKDKMNKNLQKHIEKFLN